jgi:DNA-binding transcriptional MocR family regulator
MNARRSRAIWLTRGLTVPAEQVLIVSGAQHGLAVTLMTLLKPGDVIAADALTYSGFKTWPKRCIWRSCRFLSAIKAPDLAALETLCRSRSVRAVYSMPTLHNPLGWVMDGAARAVGGDCPSSMI